MVSPARQILPNPSGKNYRIWAETAARKRGAMVSAPEPLLAALLSAVG
jgi:hypothetical protein